MNTITAFAPATLANFNVGFDVLGLSLNSVGDRVELRFNDIAEHRILEIENGPQLPREIHKNCCSVVIAAMQREVNDERGVDIRIYKGFASGSGMGSSSASSAAAAVAYNALLGSPFSQEQLVHFAAEGERIACGTAHLDNVAPAIMGGLVMLHGKKVLRLPLPEGLHVLIFFPNITINTSDSRSIVQAAHPMTSIARQMSHMGAFVRSLYEKDLELLSESLVDLMIEPSRKLIIPLFDEMRDAAHQNGALAFGISGSGPSVFALCRASEQCHEIAGTFKRLFKDSGIATQSFVEDLSLSQGAYIFSNNEKNKQYEVSQHKR